MKQLNILLLNIHGVLYKPQLGTKSSMKAAAYRALTTPTAKTSCSYQIYFWKEQFDEILAAHLFS